jgi:hypothetical protein
MRRALGTRQLAFGLPHVLFLQGCMAHYPPPPRPDPIVPQVDADIRPTPPGGSGRLLLDVVGEKAKVARVVTTVEPSYPVLPRGSWRYGKVGEQRVTELLCITPCALDLRQGAHTLVFTSLTDDTRTSSADVISSSEPSAVRHALGQSKPISSQYAGGLLLTILGGGFTTMGALATTVGAIGTSQGNQPANGDPKAFLAVGLAMLGIGLAFGTTGILMASGDRPVDQPGSTTQWALPRSVPASGAAP